MQNIYYFASSTFTILEIEHQKSLILIDNKQFRKDCISMSTTTKSSKPTPAPPTPSPPTPNQPTPSPPITPIIHKPTLFNAREAFLENPKQFSIPPVKTCKNVKAGDKVLLTFDYKERIMEQLWVRVLKKQSIYPDPTQRFSDPQLRPTMKFFGFITDLPFSFNLEELKYGDPVEFTDVNISNIDDSNTRVFMSGNRKPDSKFLNIDTKIPTTIGDITIINREVMCRNQCIGTCPEECTGSCPEFGTNLCSNCVSVRYCDIKCQMEDWNKKHKTECKHLIHLACTIKMMVDEREKPFVNSSAKRFLILVDGNKKNTSSSNMRPSTFKEWLQSPREVINLGDYFDRKCVEFIATHETLFQKIYGVPLTI